MPLYQGANSCELCTGDGFCLYTRAQTVERCYAQAWLLPLCQGANSRESLCTGDGFCLYARTQTVEGHCAQGMASSFIPGRKQV
jgi:hypothetical protein